MVGIPKLVKATLVAFFFVSTLTSQAFADCPVVTDRPAERTARCLPVDTIVAPPQSPTLTLSAVHFLITRDMLDAANAEHRRAQALEKRLADALRARQSTPRWLVAIKWVGVGVAVAGSFFAGVMVR